MSSLDFLAAKDRIVVEYDHHGAEYASRWREIERDLRERAPVAWSEAHGGFWVVTRHADVVAVASDWETFSSENDLDGSGRGGAGIFVPRNSFRYTLSESDPPLSLALRRIELPFFLPKNLKRWEPVIATHAKAAVRAVRAAGKADLVHDLCIPIPAKTVMELAGVPAEEWEAFALPAHKITQHPTVHPDYPHLEIGLVQQRILDLVRQRRDDPRDDITSALAGAVIDDQPLSEEMIVGILSAIIFGGFDTATTTLLNALLFLEGKPMLRAQLVADEGLVRRFVDELLRLYPPSHALARTAVKDSVIGGQQVKAGDRVLMSFSSANYDEDVFADPTAFSLDRHNGAKHLSFSLGVHRCLGAPLAYLEIGGALRTILTELPDYRIDRAGIQRFDTIGTVDGFKHMPATCGAPASEDDVSAPEFNKVASGGL